MLKNGHFWGQKTSKNVKKWPKNGHFWGTHKTTKMSFSMSTSNVNVKKWQKNDKKRKKSEKTQTISRKITKMECFEIDVNYRCKSTKNGKKVLKKGSKMGQKGVILRGHFQKSTEKTYESFKHGEKSEKSAKKRVFWGYTKKTGIMSFSCQLLM